MAEAADQMLIKSEAKEIERFANLRREIDRLFDAFNWGAWRRPLAGTFDVEPFWRGQTGPGGVPAVDIAEKDKEYEVTAELPGMDVSDIDVKFADGMVTIRGEKKEERDEKKQDYYLSERRYGSFQRCFQVPKGVDADKIEASFKNGVLTIKLPKAAEAQKQEKKIAIKKG
jgi:HSP20 family protein